MKRVYQAKTIEIVIYPSGRDQSETGMYIDMERNGWSRHVFLPDTTLARIVGREMYYAMVCEFFPDDFQTRPCTPEAGIIFRRIRKKSSSSRIRMTPQEMGVEADPYDKSIVDSVEQSSQTADIGESRLRVEKSVFQSIHGNEASFESASKLWWDIKFKLVLLIICWKYGLLKLGSRGSEDVETIGELFSLWKTRDGMNHGELAFEKDSTLTSLGQAIVDSVDQNGILYRLVGPCRANYWLQDEIIALQASNSIPDVDGHMLLSIDQSRILQIVLVIILFGVLVAGVGSFIMENKKIMKMLEDIKKDCKT